MNKIISFALLTLTFSFAICALRLEKVEASGFSLGISPPILQIDAMPPASIEAPLTIQNLGEETVGLKILLKPFKAKDTENGEVEYFSDNVPTSWADPLIFQKMQILDGGYLIENLTLAPTQQKNLKLHIGIPKDEPAGDYYFSILFVSKEAANEEITSSYTSGGVATNVLLSIGPKGKAQGNIEEFSVPLFLEKGPVPFTVRVKNTGEHVIGPNGAILIKNMFGQTVGKVDLLPVNILAGSIRAIPDSLQSPDATPPATLNSQLSTLNSPKALWRESFLLGLYTATLTLALSDQGPLFTKTIHFVGFPIQGLIGLLIALSFVLLVKARLKRHLETPHLRGDSLLTP